MEQVIDGVPSEGMYLVEYDEDNWKGLPADRQEYCKTVWTQKAKWAGSSRIGLWLIPDPLFPSGDKERPYFVWQANIEQAKLKSYNFHAHVRVKVVDALTGELLSAIMRQISQYPKGTDWSIVDSLGIQIERGVL